MAKWPVGHLAAQVAASRRHRSGRRCCATRSSASAAFSAFLRPASFAAMWCTSARLLALCAVFLVGGQAQPIFPEGVQSIMSSVAERQRQYVHHDAGEAAALRGLENAALDRLERDLTEESTHEQQLEDRARPSREAATKALAARGCADDGTCERRETNIYRRMPS